MQGLILAGGTGSRLFPVSLAVSKHLLPIFDKPMIYYPLANLMLAGVKRIAVMVNPRDAAAYHDLLGSGEQWGIEITILTQSAPKGIVDGIALASAAFPSDDLAVALGDNLFFGSGTAEILTKAKVSAISTAFTKRVSSPGNYGVVRYGSDGSVEEVLEKPSSPPSMQAVTGLYFLKRELVEASRSIIPSERGELEIADLLNEGIARQNVHFQKLPRGTAWFDCGTFGDLSRASEFVSIIQERQGLLVGSPDEIALRNKWITPSEFKSLQSRIASSSYGTILGNLGELD